MMQLSSSAFLGRPSGSSRRAAVSSTHDMIMGSEVDSFRPRTTDVTQGGFRKVSGHRTSPVESSDPKRSSSGRNASNIKNYESTLRGIESLNFDNDERLQY